MFDWHNWSERKARAGEAEKLAHWQQALAALPDGGDLTPFLAPEVPEAVRQKAMQRLWSRGFGAPDGLDSEFVDAASHPLLTEAEVRSLVQWQQVVAQPTPSCQAEDGLSANGGEGGMAEAGPCADQGLSSDSASRAATEHDVYIHLPAYSFLKDK